jgi:RHS repeat-associated protein
MPVLYYTARYYDPAIARFISADTIVPGAGALTIGGGGSSSGPGDPQSLNRYSYVTNNPVKNTDPTGHCSLSLAGAMECARELAPAAGVAAGVAGAAVEATIGGLMALPIGAALLASELAGDQEMTTDASGAPVPATDEIPAYNREEWGYEKQPLDGETCAYCGQELTRTPNLPNSAENDHIVSLKDAHRNGGAAWTAEEKERFANDPDNQVNSCKSCNASKRDRALEDWNGPRVRPELKNRQLERARNVRDKYRLKGPR